VIKLYLSKSIIYQNDIYPCPYYW